MVAIEAAVEGPVDAAALRRLIQNTDHVLSTIYVKNGKHPLLDSLPSYNQAAARWPWVVLIDLNGDAECAPSYASTLLSAPADHMILCITVRQLEAWLLGDQRGICNALQVSGDYIPDYPEAVEDAKRRMVSIARSSRARSIRADMVPRPGSGRTVGPGYNGRLVAFINRGWDPERAAERCPSLARALDRIRGIETPKFEP